MNAHLVGLYAKENFETTFIPITHNMSHCNGQSLLEIIPNTISESLYSVVRPYIGPIFSIH